MIEKARKSDYSRILEIWENAVIATHDFLSSEDFEYYRSRMPFYLENVDLYTYRNENNSKIIGFLGISGQKIEMLFIDEESRGKGIGKALMCYAICCLNTYYVDVNEQNVLAYGFYLKSGFKQYGRTSYDSEGKNYPIVHMKYEPDK